MPRNITKSQLKPLLAIGIACTMIFVVMNVPPLPYYRERKACEETLNQLLSKRPQNVNAQAWEVATGWAMTAYANVFFEPDLAPLVKLTAFHANIERLGQERISLDTIDWIWQQLAESGPHGRGYQQRWEPRYREELNMSLAVQQ
jgi:hypothetical protein